MEYELCCIGHITIDKVVTPAGTVLMPGGTSFYFANAVAGLDVSFRLITAVAPDEMYAVKALQARGIAVDVHPSAHTLFFENIYGPDTDHRTQRVLREADPFAKEHLSAVKASIIHLGPLLAGDISGDIIQGLAEKGRLSLDVQGFLRKVENYRVVPVDWREKKDVLPFLSYLKANEEEMTVLTGHTNIDAGAKQLLNWGVKEVIITRGSKGSVIYTGNEVYPVPAFAPEQMVDATGCGDTYMAGYLYKRCQGAGIQEAGEFAAAMATLKLQHSGPFTGTRADVNELLSRQVAI